MRRDTERGAGMLVSTGKSSFSCARTRLLVERDRRKRFPQVIANAPSTDVYACFHFCICRKQQNDGVGRLIWQGAGMPPSDAFLGHNLSVWSAMFTGNCIRHNESAEYPRLHLMCKQGIRFF